MKQLLLATIFLSLNLSGFSQIWDFNNRPPTIDDIPDYGPISENAGLQSITLTGIGPGRKSENQEVIITATSDNDELLSNVIVKYDQGETANLLFTPILNANGKAKVTVELDDGQWVRNITRKSFNVSVYAVNGKPSFQLSTDLISIDENTGKIEIKNFATNIDDGDPEMKQKLNFITTISTVKGGLTFKANPEIDERNGDLKFEINSNGYGEALVSVVLKDNGKTNNGGIDTSDVLTFIIRVEIVNDPPTLDDIPSPVTIFEDAGEQIVKLTGISPGGNENQALQLSAISDNQELIPNIIIDYIPGDDVAILKFTPAPNLFGNAQVTVAIDDGEPINNIISKHFFVIANPVADTPEVTDAVLEGGKQTSSGLVISRNPVDGDEVNHFKINGIQNGTLFFNDGVSAIQNNDFITYQEGNMGLRFTVDDGISGPGSFDIQAATGPDDIRLGGSVVTAQIIVDNDPPSIISVPDTIVEITKSYNYDVEANDPDENDVLTFIFVFPQTIQPWLKTVDNEDGTATIFGIPPSGTVGVYEIYVKVEDQFGAYDEQYYNLTVNELNKRPELSPFSKSILEDETIFFTEEEFNLSFADADGDTLSSLKVANVAQFGVLKLNGVELGLNDEIEGNEIENLTYTPDKDYFGLDIFDWNASDGKDYALVPQRISIFISSVNDQPEIIDFESDPFTFEYGDESIAITNAGVVVDADGDKIEKAIVSITKNYIQGEDSIYYENVDELTYLWQDTIGVLTIRGIATPAVYQDALRSLRYVNLSRLAPNGDFREAEIVLFDSDTMSIPYLRQIDFENTFVDLDIPNAFSPNGDEVNDTWNIENLNRYENYEIAVYSRTGLLIFESDSYLNEWDGRYNGEFVPVGNYYYLISINKFEKVYKGAILVLR